MSLDTSTTPDERLDSTDSAQVEPPEQTAETSNGGTPAESSARESAAPDNETAETPEAESKPKRGRPKGGTARKTRTVELTLTVTGTADGEWQAELKHGSKWVARGLDIPAAAVSRAAKELHADLSVPIDEVINAAREQQQAKVAQLEAELEQAKQTLAELEN
ncbi:hypothetical protein BAY61_29165 [Prauserella marina]|uniref:Uncharacterized protein n=1 Tax=Prauserella marina TaxID=530584 RepID=A0A222VWP5_9PSEU|nr:DUF6319 family protein [Prauserella marina]ASR38396.1 hypothetical protein BAY61_29165 [Prauserella marina]PWV78372.1 hypothetical protein DES30_104103 [Prauserella marina]SDC84536.1 hypothetical protein SAMN05421630_104103 [Prauserella marina]